jgi:hypothetical protein
MEHRAATFWGAALGYWWKSWRTLTAGTCGSSQQLGWNRALTPARARRQTVKNRMHLDLRVHDLDTETNRLRHPGALIPGLSKPADYENNHPENIRQVA